MQKLADRLKRTRKIAGFSARMLDELAGLTPGHTSSIEAGRRQIPSTSTASALARVLGVSLDWLIAGVGEPPTKESVRSAVERARTKAA